MKNVEIENPFSVTKATDFTNQEIADLWVDFYTKSGEDLGHYLNPSDLMPKYVIGGKGCGKTHLLRYFSYPLQKLRNEDSYSLIKHDKYIGLHIDLGAMNSARMYGCDVKDDQWDSLFGYYLELFAGLHLLKALRDLFLGLKIDKEKEALVISNIKKTVCYEKDIFFGNSIEEFSKYINEQKKIVDFHINNAALKRSIDFEDLNIKLSSGDIFFVIPKVITETIAELQKVKFIFILDELEKLREYQKIFINTLVWDKKAPSTFWIGARTYGFTTRSIRTGEVLINGSEFQEISLDDLMSEDENRYKTFAINLCAKRLKGVIPISDYDGSNIGELRSQIDEYFQDFNEDIFLDGIQKSKRELPHQRNFKSKVKEGIEKKMLRTGEDLSNSNEIFDKYIRDNNLLLEKYKILLFYKLWAKTNNLKEILESISEELEKYRSNKFSKINSYEEKYKMDLLAQLIFENNEKIFSYTGIDNFIKISSENPRALLVILKEIFERSKLKHENPFQKKKSIKIKTQSLGMYNASKWFYEDTEAYGEDGKVLYKCIYNLATILQGIRFSDKPSETSPSSFSFKPEKVSKEASKFLKLALIHRAILEVKGRHDKNSERIENAYQINRMLAPYFNLPISRRGIVPFNESLFESIFNPNKHANFQELYNKYINRMNAPFDFEAQVEMF